MGAAIDRYLGENGFDRADYTAPTVEVEAFGRSFRLRNRPNRQWAIPLHDLHHVATGYGTDLIGEAEIGVWELRGGCRRPVVYGLNIAAVVMGLFLAPLRLWRAFADARGARTLYVQEHDYAALLALPLGELRRRLGVPPAGVVRAPRRLHAKAELATRGCPDQA